jgi:hypothetical protein
MGGSWRKFRAAGPAAPGPTSEGLVELDLGVVLALDDHEVLESMSWPLAASPRFDPTCSAIGKSS